MEKTNEATPRTIYFIGGKYYERQHVVIDGDVVYCVEEGQISAKPLDEQITKFGDRGIVDLHYDRVKLDNGEEYVYWPHKFMKLIEVESLTKAVNAYDSLVEGNEEQRIKIRNALHIINEELLPQKKELEAENQKLREAIETLHGWIKSDSVYTLLRYGAKSPSHSGVDDCEDDFNSDLYNLSEELRAKAKNV